jgi:hypothetical protein
MQSVLKKWRKGRRVQYLVKWLGYPESFNGWIFKQDLQLDGRMGEQYFLDGTVEQSKHVLSDITQ